MPRHSSGLLEPDKRLRRPLPNLLPSHRRCTLCKLILPLDALNFYERRGERYKWNLSFYGTRCKPCASKAAMERKAAQRSKVNEQARDSRAAKKEAERFQSPVFKAACDQAERQSRHEGFERRQRLAWAKLTFRKARIGPYVDGIKLMIDKRRKEYEQRRRTRLVIHEDTERENALSTALSRPPNEIMEALRALHKSKQLR